MDFGSEVSGQLVTRLSCGNERCYYLDARSGFTYSTPTDQKRLERRMDLNGWVESPYMLTDLYIMHNGEVLILQDYCNLRHLRSEGMEALDHLLYHSSMKSILTIIGTVAGVLLTAIVVSIAFFTVRRGSVPLGIYWSVVLLSLGMGLCTALHFYIFREAASESEANLRTELVDSLVNQISLSEELFQMEEFATEELSKDRMELFYSQRMSKISVPSVRWVRVTVSEVTVLPWLSVTTQ